MGWDIVDYLLYRFYVKPELVPKNVRELGILFPPTYNLPQMRLVSEVVA